MTKGSTQQEDIIILNLYAPNNVVSKNIEQNLSELNRKINLQSLIGKGDRKITRDRRFDQHINKCELIDSNIILHNIYSNI